MKDLYVENYELYVNNDITYDIVVDSGTTKYNVTIENMDNFDVKYNTITPKELGFLKLAFIEEYSGIRHVYNFKVKNYIHINDYKFYNITGSYTIKDNAIELKDMAVQTKD